MLGTTAGGTALIHPFSPSAYKLIIMSALAAPIQFPFQLSPSPSLNPYFSFLPFLASSGSYKLRQIS
jgi:hypothetical protein